jgi:hypothetical protein
MICRLCHADHDGPALCPACVRDLSAVYWGSGGLRTVDFPRISGAGRSAGDLNSGRPAIGRAQHATERTAEAVSPS